MQQNIFTVQDANGNPVYLNTNSIIDQRKDQILDDKLHNYFYIEAITSRGASISIVYAEEHYSEISIEYKIDNGPWQEYNFNRENPVYIELQENQRAYFKGEQDHISFTSEGYCYTGFLFDGYKKYVSLGGNIASLVNFKTQISEYEFFGLFSGSDNIKSAKDLILPFETLAPYCYSQMFKGTSIENPPQIMAKNLSQSCCEEMFSQCTKLVEAPDLNAAIMSSDCYNGMFMGCTSLTRAPQLPSMVLASYCYGGMFRGCTSLITPPQLPATTLAYSCYAQMFNGCTSLKTAPELPATVMKTWCYSAMFQNSGLITPPELPATTLANSCYIMMFSGCSQLTKAPELPATKLEPSCYKFMFWGCSKLTELPNLPASKLAISCYWNMAIACDNIKIARASFEVPVTAFIRNWIESPKGVLIKPKNVQWSTAREVGLPEGWAIIEKEESIYENKYLTLIALTEGTIQFIGESGQISYSIDEGETWSNMESSFTLEVSQGERISLKGTLPKIEDNTIQNKFGKFIGSTAEFNIEGNIMSLICKDDFINSLDLEDNFGGTNTFTNLFSNTNVVDTNNLILPALFLTPFCYSGMFSSCKKLKVSPKKLPAKFLTEHCYDFMFGNCSLLQTAPELPATELTDSCYLRMFYLCISLEKAPELPAVQINIASYSSMFEGCTSLNYIKALFDDLPIEENNKTSNWVKEVSPVGTFIYNKLYENPQRGNDFVPEGWLALTEEQQKFIMEDSNSISKIYQTLPSIIDTQEIPFTNAENYYYFGKINPCDITQPSRIKYHVLAFSIKDNNYLLDSIVEFTFGKNGVFKEYSVQNNLENNDYRPIDYHLLFEDKQFLNSYIGFCRQNYNIDSNDIPQNIPAALSIRVSLISCENCTVEFNNLIYLGNISNDDPIVDGIINNYVQKIEVPIFTGTHKSTYLIETTSENINLLPNQVYNFGIISNAIISLEGSNNPANSYQFFFTAESEETSITLPSFVRFANDFDWQIVANRRYSVYIINGMATVNYI